MMRTLCVQRNVRRTFAYLKPHSMAIATVVLLTVASSCLSALDPLLHGALFDRIAKPTGPGTFGMGTVLIALAFAFLGRQLLEGLATLTAWRVRLQVNRELLAEATARLHALPLAFHQGHGVGDTMTRLDRGITALMEGLSSIAFQLVPSFVYLVCSSYIMFRLNPVLGSVAVGFVVPAVVLGGCKGARVVEHERALMDRWASIYNRFHQVLVGIKTVKIFAREKEEHERFVSSVAGAQARVLEGVRLQTGLSQARVLCVNAGRIAVLGLGGWFVVRGQLGVGTLVAFLGYMGGLYGPAQTLLALYETVRKAELGLEAVFGVLDATDAVPESPGALSPHRFRGEIRFEQVSFQYETGNTTPALCDVSFSIRPGEFVAIVGPSGAGKSTIADLILRLYDPTVGRILVDGYDLRELSQRSLRRQIGIVAQENFLFDDTIEANLRYGALEATPEQIRVAMRAAQADTFVDRLPNGLKTLIGRGGVQLSGGERQRLAIARTLLKDPSIVILDEPSSNLDVEGERVVHAAIERLAAGRTTLLIAHRLGTTLGADRVLVVENGRLVQNGRPGDLLIGSGPYRRMIDLWRGPVSVEASMEEKLALGEAG